MQSNIQPGRANRVQHPPPDHLWSQQQVRLKRMILQVFPLVEIVPREGSKSSRLNSTLWWLVGETISCHWFEKMIENYSIKKDSEWSRKEYKFITKIQKFHQPSYFLHQHQDDCYWFHPSSRMATISELWMLLGGKKNPQLSSSTSSSSKTSHSSSCGTEGTHPRRSTEVIKTDRGRWALGFLHHFLRRRRWLSGIWLLLRNIVRDLLLGFT